MAQDRIKILAIDDIQDNLLTLQAIISETFENAIFFTALSGTKGLELAKSINPDVILLDIVMPVMDGYQVCEILKKDDTLKEIPVVFVTANKDDKESRIRALNVGAEAFLSKPIDESELIAQIRAMYKVRKANLQKMNESKRLEVLVADKTKELNTTIAVLKYEKDLAQNYLNIAGVMIVILDLNGNVSLMNKKGCSIIGIHEKDIIGKNWFDNYIPEGSRNEMRNIISKSFTNEADLKDKYENTILTTSGEKRLISWNNSFLYDNEENIIGMLCSGEDITEMKNKQTILLDSFDRLDRSQRISNVGSWELDLDTNLIWGSQEAFNIYELPKDSEYISLPKIQEMTIPKDREMMNKALVNLIQNGDPYDMYFTFNNGTKKKHIHSKAIITKNSLGKPSKVLGVIKDITELKTKEDDLRLAGNIFENSIKNAPIPIMIHAEDGTVLNISENWTTLTHYKKTDIPTIFEWTKKAYGKNKDEVFDFIKKLYVLTEIQHDGEFEVTTKDGRKLTWDFNSSYIGNLPDGRAVAMSIATDITERIAREQENMSLIEKVRTTKTLLKASLESPKDMIILSIDKDCNYNYFNKSHEEYMLNVYGSKIEIGSNILEQITVIEDREKAEKYYSKVLSGVPHSNIETYGKDGNYYFESYFYPIYDTDNLVIGASIFARDITARVLEQQKLKDSLDRLDRSQKISNVGSWELDLDTNLIWASQETFNIYELPRDSEYISLPEIQEMIIPEDREIVDKALVNLIQNGGSCEVYYTLNNGTEKKHIHSKATITKNSLGKPSKVLGVIKDITELKKKEEELMLVGNIFENSIKNAPVPIMIHAEDGSVLNISQTATKLAHYTKADIPTIFDWTKKAYGKNKDEVLDFIRKLYVSPEIQHDGEFEVTTKDGRKLIWDFNSGVIGKLPDGRAVAMSVATDVTEDRKKQKEIMYISYHDSLTGLHNRRYYEDNLSKLDIPENYPLTIVMSDINGLKLINDAFGHSVGDKLLISAAKIISDSCRETDLIARIGGDEFIIAMANTSGKEAEKIIDKINKEAKKITVESIELSISFGFDTKNEINEDIHEIYRNAEDLMYREKLLAIPSMRSGAIETILNTLNEKDENSEIHSRMVSEISEKIAVAFGMDRLEVNEVKTAGLLHDIGKIIIPISIITKEGKLTTEEYDLIKGHPEIGFRILNSTYNMRNISNIVLNHHERWDGFGYPRGIKTDEIPVQSRIIAIADSFDAMTSKRTYREVYTNEQALDEIIRCSGTQFDPELVQVFTDNFEKIIEVK